MKYVWIVVGIVLFLTLCVSDIFKSMFNIKSKIVSPRVPLNPTLKCCICGTLVDTQPSGRDSVIAITGSTQVALCESCKSEVNFCG